MLRPESHSRGSYVLPFHVTECNQALDVETVTVSPDHRFGRDDVSDLQPLPRKHGSSLTRLTHHIVLSLDLKESKAVSKDRQFQYC